MSQNNRQKVLDALKTLSAKTKPSEIFFRIYYTAGDVAKEAGVSESSARKWLNEAKIYAGYRVRRLHGIIGYRYDEPGCY